MSHEEDKLGIPTPMPGYCVVRSEYGPEETDADTGAVSRETRLWMHDCGEGKYMIGSVEHRIHIPKGSRLHLVPGAPHLRYATMDDGYEMARLVDVVCFHEPAGTLQ